MGSRGHEVLDKKTGMGTEVPRADPLGHQGTRSDGLKRGCPPNISVLAANSRVLPAGLHIHVIEGRLPYHVVCPCKLYSISRLQGRSIWTHPSPNVSPGQRALLSPLFTSCNLRYRNGRHTHRHPCTIQGSPVASPSGQCGSRCSCLLHS